MISSLIFLSSKNGKIINNNTYEDGKKYLKGDDNVYVFKYRESTHLEISLPFLLILE